VLVERGGVELDAVLGEAARERGPPSVARGRDHVLELEEHGIEHDSK
jgi:hypothetical protein